MDSALILVVTFFAVAWSAPAGTLTQLSFKDAAPSIPVSMNSSDEHIWELEWDQYTDDGSMLVAWGNALVSVDGKGGREVIAGSVDDRGYKEGTGKDARFSRIDSFVQISKSRVVVSDRMNCCLRVIDRVTGVTSPFSGKCDQCGAWKSIGIPLSLTDGSRTEAEFGNPAGLLIDQRDPTKIIVMDDMNHAIRSVDISTGAVTTLYNSFKNLQRPRAAAFDKKNKNILYVTHRRQISKIDLSDNTVTLLSGEEPENPKLFTIYDGEFENATWGYFMPDIVAINGRYIAVADFRTHKIRILDLIDREVFSICANEIEQVFNEKISLTRQAECGLYRPTALMYDKGKMYIGEGGQITIKSVTMNEGAGGVVG